MQVIGAVIDVQFEGDLPPVLTALTALNGDDVLVLEVAQHLNDTVVRTIAMGSTSAVTAGMEVNNTGNKIAAVPSQLLQGLALTGASPHVEVWSVLKKPSPTPQEAEIIEDLIISAAADAVRKALSSSLGVPGEHLKHLRRKLREARGVGSV